MFIDERINDRAVDAELTDDPGEVSGELTLSPSVTPV
jgi:hypothetical protein